MNGRATETSARRALAGGASAPIRHLAICGCTDVGAVRDSNQDTFVSRMEVAVSDFKMNV